jgi:N-acetyltransferase
VKFIARKTSTMNEYPTTMIQPRSPLDIQPITLENAVVRLVPLEASHIDALTAIGAEESLWRYFTTRQDTPVSMAKWVNVALENQAKGTELPFTVIHKADGQIVGSTRYMNIAKADYRLEIGSTWYGTAWQRTAINTHCKFLLLRHAFESLLCYRVEFKTDMLNERSRLALLRIGATQEGIFRNHMVMHDQRLRHSVYFSVLSIEWQTIKQNLLNLMNR